MPRKASRAIARCWASRAAAVQTRIWISLARPPAARTRSASDGARRTTIQRPPSSGSGRLPRRPCQPSAPVGSSGVAPLAPPTASSPPQRSAASASSAAVGRSDRRGRVRIEGKVVGRCEGSCESGGRRDHRGVVGAEREGREAGVGQRGPKLRVRRHAADDRQPRVASRALGSGLEAADERPHDRALVGRREIRAPRLELPLAEVADGVEQRRLEAREREVEPGNAGDGKAERLRDRPRARAGRSRRRRDSRGRAGARPCRTPRPRRRRASSRGSGTTTGRGPRAAACGPRSRAGT